MASAYPDLFSTEEAARKAIERENPDAPLEEYLIRLCPEFRVIDYRVAAHEITDPHVRYDQDGSAIHRRGHAAFHTRLRRNNIHFIKG